MLIIKNVRLAFPHLFKPSSFSDGSAPRYSALFIFGENDPQVEAVRAAIDKVGQAKWGKDWPRLKEDFTRRDRTPLRDGNGKAQYDGFAGRFYLSASRAASAGAPKVFDIDKAELTEIAGRPYAGCYVDAAVDIWAQDNQYGKRINATLSAVRFVADGDAFGAPPVPDASVFDDII